MDENERDLHSDGFGALVGYRVAEWEVGRARVELELDARHLNIHQVAHGGVLATLMDKAGGLCGVLDPEGGPHRRCMTISMTVSYLAPAHSGRLVATAVRRGGGRGVFFASVECRDEADELVALAEASYRVRPGVRGEPEAPPAST